MSDDGPDGMLAYMLAIQQPDRNDPSWPLPSFDARDWAAAFCKTARERWGITGLDEEMMTAWFACALMRGYDQRAMEATTAVKQEG